MGFIGKIQKCFELRLKSTRSTLEPSGRNPKYNKTLLPPLVLSISDPAFFKLFLVLQDVVQAANVGQNLNDKLIATMQGKLGVAAPANTSGRTGDTAGAQVRLM